MTGLRIRFGLAIMLAAVAATAACDACQPSQPPVTVDQIVYGELVESGCLQASDGGVQAVQQEHALAAQPTWLGCMYDGGTVQQCGAPCR